MEREECLQYKKIKRIGRRKDEEEEKEGEEEEGRRIWSSEMREKEGGGITVFANKENKKNCEEEG